MRTRGNFAMFHGAGVLCGELDRPLPIWLMLMMQYLAGSSARPLPT
jgi:hypothetical protein